MQNEKFFNNSYFDYREIKDLNSVVIEGYNKCEKPKNERDYSVSDGFICFEKKDGFFYSEEFDALVLSWHIFPDDKEYENDCCGRVLRDLNKMRDSGSI
jgi:hypothetical protein